MHDAQSFEMNPVAKFSNASRLWLTDAMDSGLRESTLCTIELIPGLIQSTVFGTKPDHNLVTPPSLITALRVLRKLVDSPGSADWDRITTISIGIITDWVTKAAIIP